MRVAVAMSGGVDSLRAAVLLKENGCAVTGIHMRLPLPEADDTIQDETFTRREEHLLALAADFSIPLRIVDMRRGFEEKVVHPFLEAYQAGCTPNPCILCNVEIKFGVLLQKAIQMGVNFLATGHYARISPPESSKDRFKLLRAKDSSKDQSYFLFGLTQPQLAHVLFPLGCRTKTETLEWAKAVGLSHLLREESQEICFIPDGKYREFLMRRLKLDPDAEQGLILDEMGNRLGQHKGVFAYTVGQRRGLSISSSAPYYVSAMDPVANVVRVGRRQDLYSTEFQVEKTNWVSIPPPIAALRGQVRIRHQHLPAIATIVPRGETDAVVTFDQPQWAVTPGQAAVFYDGDLVLGGGVIRRKRSRLDGI